MINYRFISKKGIIYQSSSHAMRSLTIQAIDQPCLYFIKANEPLWILRGNAQIVTNNELICLQENEGLIASGPGSITLIPLQETVLVLSINDVLYNDYSHEIHSLPLAMLLCQFDDLIQISIPNCVGRGSLQEHIFDYITLLYCDPYHSMTSLTKLASSLYVSVSYLSRLITSSTLRSYTMHSTLARINAALPLIIETHQSMRHVAHQTGYSGVKELNRATHKLFGKTARQVRFKLSTSVIEQFVLGILNSCVFGEKIG